MIGTHLILFHLICIKEGLTQCFVLASRKFILPMTMETESFLSTRIKAQLSNKT